MGKYARVEFDFLGYTIVARGYVNSESDVEIVRMSIRDLSQLEYPNKETGDMIEQECIEQLANHVYSDELNF